MATIVTIHRAVVYSKTVGRGVLYLAKVHCENKCLKASESRRFWVPPPPPPCPE